MTVHINCWKFYNSPDLNMLKQNSVKKTSTAKPRAKIINTWLSVTKISQKSELQTFKKNV